MAKTIWCTWYILNISTYFQIKLPKKLIQFPFCLFLGECTCVHNRSKRENPKAMPKVGISTKFPKKVTFSKKNLKSEFTISSQNWNNNRAIENLNHTQSSYIAIFSQFLLPIQTDFWRNITKFCGLRKVG